MDIIIKYNLLPSKQELIRFLGSDDFFLWQYYGEGILSRIQAWIFRSRIKTLLKFLRRNRLKPKIVLDVGCGPMFISYPLCIKFNNEYIGIDIMSAERLRKYRSAMKSVGVKSLEVVKASAEQLPFREHIFDFVLSLDVLEHLKKPRDAVKEICYVTKHNGVIVISLPLENLIQRLSRIGFILMRVFGDHIIKRTKPIPITKTPEYHYIGDIKSYHDMIKLLKENFKEILTKYTPIGFHRAININAVHIFRKV